jgi:DAACS family dicarboxylate/amino acid:cation (Na+ or H+) symporter
VGTNFNNDGTALYQGVVAMFFAQAEGMSLDTAASIALALATIVAALGAGGIPSGSFITLPLTFALVGIPIAGLPVLLTVDWFLDRCRTAVNVSGDMTVAVLIDRPR